MRPTVSVVVPARNEEKRLPKLLASLKKQTVLPDEIIVVDNNSTDATTQIAEKFGCKVLRENNKGTIQTRNKGFNEAKSEIIARTDADSILPENWIKTIKEFFQKHKEYSALTGPVVYYDLVFPSKKYSTWLLKFLKKITGFYFLLGPNMAITKQAWEVIKNEVCLDNKAVHEDFDLAVHLHMHDLQIAFNPDLVSFSSGRRIVKNPFSFFMEYPWRTYKTIKKHKFK